MLAIVEAAAEKPAEEREKWARGSCEDPQVLREVLQLLADGVEPEGPSAGRQYGRYTIIEAIGKGGMGEVFAAADAELGRKVAMKFVRAGIRFQPEAADRLEREARSASILNHPNLVTVYDILRSDLEIALVSEFVEGKSLRAFCGTPQPSKQVIFWSAQIARGLTAAHRSGIVHGDIKPENIMARPDGYIKVLDFGLAHRHGARDLWGDMPVGSIGYMSPEQTRGEILLPATDVFSLGVVMVELLTGKHPFLRDGAAPTTRAIREPEALFLTGIDPKLAKGSLAPLIRRMLHRDPAERPSAAEVAERLEAIGNAGHIRRAVTRTVGVVAAIAAAASIAYFRPSSAPPTVFPVTDYAGEAVEPALSPDGAKVAFVWSGLDDYRNVYVRSIDRDDLLRLSTSPREESSPSWSPNGRQIAFVRRSPDGGYQDVVVIPAGGGPERIFGRTMDRQGYRGLEWWPDSGSVILRDAVGDGRPLVRLFPDGSRIPLTNPGIGRQDYHPALSPDRGTLAFMRASVSAAFTCRMPLWGREEKRVNCSAQQDGVVGLGWLADSRRLLAGGRRGIGILGSDGRLQPLILGKVDDITVNAAATRAIFSRKMQDLNIWKLDTATGRASKFLASRQEDSEPDFSPDGQKIVFRSNRTGSQELYICDKAGGHLRQLTSLHGEVGSARWSPDGKWIAFDGFNLSEIAPPRNAQTTNIYVVSADGGAPVRLTDNSVECLVPAWSRDSRWVYFSKEATAQQIETWKVPVTGGTSVQVAAMQMFDAVESEDGRWLYFTRPADGLSGIWRRPVAGGRPELIPGTDKAYYRSWNLRGNLLVFHSESKEPGFRILDLITFRERDAGPPPKAVFNGPRNVSVSPDGATILFTQMDVLVGDLFRIDLQGIH